MHTVLKVIVVLSMGSKHKSVKELPLSIARMETTLLPESSIMNGNQRSVINRNQPMFTCIVTDHSHPVFENEPCMVSCESVVLYEQLKQVW